MNRSRSGETKRRVGPVVSRSVLSAFLLSLLLSLLLTVSSNAADQTTERWTLNQCIESALEHRVAQRHADLLDQDRIAGAGRGGGQRERDH